MDRPAAYYLPLEEDTFESTTAATTPWDLGAQHGGPPSALDRLMSVADSTNGVSARLPILEWWSTPTRSRDRALDDLRPRRGAGQGRPALAGQPSLTAFDEVATAVGTG